MSGPAKLRDDGDPYEPELVVHPPRIIEMADEQRRTALRLLVGLIDARLARRRAAGRGFDLRPPEPGQAAGPA